MQKTVLSIQRQKRDGSCALDMIKWKLAYTIVYPNQTSMRLNTKKTKRWMRGFFLWVLTLIWESIPPKDISLNKKWLIIQMVTNLHKLVWNLVYFIKKIFIFFLMELFYLYKKILDHLFEFRMLSPKWI